MWRLVCVPSPSGLGHLGREHKLLSPKAKLAGKWKRMQAMQGPLKLATLELGFPALGFYPVLGVAFS